MNLEELGLPLGKTVAMSDEFSPDHLAGVPRAWAREREGVDISRFQGFDEWNLWEVSWLDHDGKPVMATGRYTVPHDSPNLIESKSIKLYLNSMNNTRLGNDLSAVAARCSSEMSEVAGAAVSVEFFPLKQGPLLQCDQPDGVDLDAQDFIDNYSLGSDLIAEGEEAQRFICEGFRSLCPVTAQPDWATIIIDYEGPSLDRSRLYSYLMSFRNHQGFHEACCERIAGELLSVTNARALSVEARFLRRGGIDINPVRVMKGQTPTAVATRLYRQ